MRHFVALTLFILTASLTAQVEHAPTPAQCQSDQKLWMSIIEGPEESQPTYDVLNAWYFEMRKCDVVDPAKKFDYYNLRSEISTWQEVREFEFLHRHNLWNQFMEEDAAGQR